MIDGHFLRRDSDILPFSSDDRKARVEQLRRHFSPRDARLLGIDESYGEANRTAGLQRSLLNTIGATLATTTLLLTFGALALPAAAFA